MLGTINVVIVDATAEACALIERAKRERAGALVITIGTGCCESTAPFLYEDFWPGPDQEQVGEAAGVPIYAPEYLRRLYPGDETLLIDVNADDLGESMSIETEYGRRFTLRRPGEERRVRATATGADETSVTRKQPVREVTGELSPALRNVKLR